MTLLKPALHSFLSERHAVFAGQYGGLLDADMKGTTA
jgi:hypothetical protein